MWVQEYWIDEDQPQRSGLGMTTGLAVGLAIGAATCLLMATRRGAGPRPHTWSSAQRVERRAAEAYDGASHAVGDVAARSRRAIDAGREAREAVRSAETSDPAPVPLP
jgi:hypothetical protein